MHVTQHTQPQPVSRSNGGANALRGQGGQDRAYISVPTTLRDDKHTVLLLRLPLPLNQESWLQTNKQTCIVLLWPGLVPCTQQAQTATHTTHTHCQCAKLPSTHKHKHLTMSIVVLSSSGETCEKDTLTGVTCVALYVCVCVYDMRKAEPQQTKLER